MAGGRVNLHMLAWMVAALLSVCAPGVQARFGPEPESVSAAQGESVELRQEQRTPLGRPVGHRHAGADEVEAASRGDGGWYGRTLLALLGVIAIIVGAKVVVSRAARTRGGLAMAIGPGGRAPSGVLAVLGRYPIARGQTLILLKVDRRVLLVAQCMGLRGGAPVLSTLCEMTEPEDVASLLAKTREADGESMAERFQSMLHRFGQAPDGAAASIVEEVEAAEPGVRGGLSSLRSRLAHLSGAAREASV